MTSSALLSAALAEARASAPSGVVVLEMLALYHPSFVNEQGQPSPFFAVNNNESISAKLESTAPQFANQYVDWQPLAFRSSKPDMSPKGVPVFQFEIDNVNDELADQIERSQGEVPQQPIYCVTREYLSTNLSAPSYISPYIQAINVIDVLPTVIKCRAQVTDSSNTRFLRRSYGLKQFPGLIK